MPYLMLAPSVVGIVAVILYPFVRGFAYSLTNSTLLQGGAFVGLANYLALPGNEEFQHAVGFSVLFAVGNVVGCYLLGLGLALLLNMQIPGRGFFRAALLMPWVVPSIVSVIGWKWLIADQSAPLNHLIVALGGQPIYVLSSENWAITAVIVVKIWRSFPFMMLSLLAALQAIDSALYEAAALDGASRWQSFRHITLPNLRGITVVLGILMTIWSVNDFETPFLLTNGGPSEATQNLVMLAYKYTFVRNQVGLGAAASFTALAVLAALAIWLMRRQEAAA